MHPPEIECPGQSWLTVNPGNLSRTVGAQCRIDSAGMPDRGTIVGAIPFELERSGIGQHTNYGDITAGETT